MPKKPVLTVGEVAARSGVAVSTIHYYEEKGLIQSWRSESNQRRYNRGILRRISIILIAKRAGIPLRVIREYLDKLPQGTISQSDWQAMSQEWYQMLNERIVSLLQLRDQMGTCIGCGCLSMADCPLRNPDDVLADRGPGPRILIDDRKETVEQSEQNEE